MTVMDECDCGWCGRCAAQLEWDRYLENTGGWHTPKGSEDGKEDRYERED